MSSAKEKVEKSENKKNNKEKELEKIKNPNKVATNKKRRILLVTISLVVILVLAVFFSVVFAFIQQGKNTIVKGVSAKGVEFSNLTVSDAKEKFVEQINKELKTPIKLVYGDYTLDVNVSDLEFSYNIDEILEEAYRIGRTDNIIESNYLILSTIFKGKEIEPKYSYNEKALETIIENVATSIPDKVSEYTFYVEDKELIITPGKDGIIVKNQELKDLIISSILNRDSNIENLEKQELQIPTENKVADAINIDNIYKEVYCEPQDAYLVKEPFELVKDISGVDFAISIDEAKALITGDKEEYIIPLKITPANKTVADLGEEAFPHTLSTYSTNYNAGYTARSTNLKIASSKINGTVLLPGEEFSFNKIVGKRTIQDGYQNAPIYENGKVVDGLAGGICQISSTLYNAVLLANLEIVERRNHNFTSTYVPEGRDATVVYGAIDFKFKNTREYPIKINSSVSGGVATFTIKGIKQETEYDVKIFTNVAQVIPFSEELEEDSSIAPGTKTVVQAGHNGSKVNSYRALYLNGKEISRELLATDTYKVMNRIVKVPVGTSAETTTPEAIIEQVTGTKPTEETSAPNVEENVQKPDDSQNTANNVSENTNTTNNSSENKDVQNNTTEDKVDNNTSNTDVNTNSNTNTNLNSNTDTSNETTNNVVNNNV